MKMKLNFGNNFRVSVGPDRILHAVIPSPQLSDDRNVLLMEEDSFEIDDLEYSFFRIQLHLHQ